MEIRRILLTFLQKLRQIISSTDSLRIEHRQSSRFHCSQFNFSHIPSLIKPTHQKTHPQDDESEHYQFNVRKIHIE